MPHGTIRAYKETNSGKITGLLFTGGEGPSPEIIKKLFNEFSSGYERIIVAADSGLELAESAGIKPDWIIGDMDSISDISRLSVYPPQNVIRYGHDKDFTDTELAFNLLKEKGCDEVIIIGGGGGRLDHLLGIRSFFERDIFPCRWITSAEDIYCLNAESTLALNIPAGAIVSVFPLGADQWEAVSIGLKWSLDRVKWNRGFFGLSNIAIDGNFSITVLKGRFLVIVPL